MQSVSPEHKTKIATLCIRILRKTLTHDYDCTKSMLFEIGATCSK